MTCNGSALLCATARAVTSDHVHLRPLSQFTEHGWFPCCRQVDSSVSPSRKSCVQCFMSTGYITVQRDDADGRHLDLREAEPDAYEFPFCFTLACLPDKDYALSAQ